MNNWIVSQIRTYVPIAIGGVLAWVAVQWGIGVPEDLQNELTVLLTGLITATYYGIVHALEQRWPRVGVLLGRAALPYYDGGNPEPAPLEDGE